MIILLRGQTSLAAGKWPTSPTGPGWYHLPISSRLSDNQNSAGQEPPLAPRHAHIWMCRRTSCPDTRTRRRGSETGS